MMENLLMATAKPPDAEGDMLFLGEVPVASLITGNALASLVGLTGGTSFNAQEPWLKFRYKGRTIFVSKKPYRHTVDWRLLDAAGIVRGSKIVEILGSNYSVGLLSGLDPDVKIPAVEGKDLVGTHDSEWSRLLFPITAPYPDDPRTSQNIPNQAQYSIADLGIVIGAGGYSWCSDSYTSPANNVVRRGYRGVSQVSYSAYSSFGDYSGWRPKLELIE